MFVVSPPGSHSPGSGLEYGPESGWVVHDTAVRTDTKSKVLTVCLLVVVRLNEFNSVAEKQEDFSHVLLLLLEA